MPNIVINGANGYVASHFIYKLLNQGHKAIALVRDGNGYPANEKMKDALATINNGQQPDFRKLTTYSYSLIEKDFSLALDQLDDIFSDQIEFFHFAASLKFSNKDQGEIMQTNVDGVENSIRTFLKYAKPGSRFFFMSTVYSCGKTSEIFEERFYENEDIGKFRNYYEQSKRYAENVVKKYIENDNLSGHVLRLSQVVGNNKTGVTNTEYGIFDFAKRIKSFSKEHPNQTVRIRVDPDSTQNLISIDTVVDCLMEILDNPHVPSVINIISKTPVKNDSIVKGICKYLPINIIQDKSVNRKDLNSLERIVAAGMSFTGVYALSKLEFDSKNLDTVYSANGNEITEQSLNRMLEYFITEFNENR